MIDKITLDDHGINHKHVLDCLKYLKDYYNGEVQHLKVMVHYDLEQAKTNKQKGRKCKFWLVSPTMYKRVIYPCCTFPNIECFDKHTKISDVLRKAGWILDNPYIIETLLNWKETIPEYVTEQCYNNCWRPFTSSGKAYKITLKSNDVIKKL